MIAIILSKEDEASMTIGHALRSLAPWEHRGVFCGDEVVGTGHVLLVPITDTHLYHDHIDQEITDELGAYPQAIIFASRHKSLSNKQTLSVHPVGNYGEALYGGKQGALVPTAPFLMRAGLQVLYKKKVERQLPHDVCFEVTHHGPLLASPAFFIEIGSSSKEWRDMAVAQVIGETLLEILSNPIPPGDVAIGFGGGHYAPRFTDIALRDNVAFGHMVPSYHLDKITPQILDQIISCTPGVGRVYCHGKIGGDLKRWSEERGLTVLEFFPICLPVYHWGDFSPGVIWLFPLFIGM